MSAIHTLKYCILHIMYCILSFTYSDSLDVFEVEFVKTTVLGADRINHPMLQISVLALYVEPFVSYKRFCPDVLWYRVAIVFEFASEF